MPRERRKIKNKTTTAHTGQMIILISVFVDLFYTRALFVSIRFHQFPMGFFFVVVRLVRCVTVCTLFHCCCCCFLHLYFIYLFIYFILRVVVFHSFRFWFDSGVETLYYLTLFNRTDLGVTNIDYFYVRFFFLLLLFLFRFSFII